MRLLKRGKVKDIYLLDDKRLLFDFTDRVSAFDVILPDIIPRKGEILCKFAAFWFETLNVKNHIIEVVEPNRMIVERLNMIPIECIVRGYLYGSLYERVKKGEVTVDTDVLAAKLSHPYFDITTKLEVKDRPMGLSEAFTKGWLTESEASELEELSIRIYEKISSRVKKAGFILADLKLEFGKNMEEEILLADSIGPDEFRLWSEENYRVGRPQESYDKQLIRDKLLEMGYKRKIEEAVKYGKPIPEPPHLPRDLIEETAERYKLAYEMITGRTL